jgi:YD repeat-containing protein
MKKHHLLPFFYILTAFCLNTSLVYSQEYIPDYYSEAGGSSKRSYTQDSQNEYVDPFSGGLNLSVNDMVIPGNGGLDIVIKRTYRALSIPVGFLGAGGDRLGSRKITGVGWDLHFGRIWVNSNFIACGAANNQVNSDQNPVLELSDGSKKVLVKSQNSQTGSNYTLITKDMWAAKCVNSKFVVYAPNGTEYEFGFRHGNIWNVTKITDTSSNTLTFSYKSSSSTQYPILDVIDASDGRKVTFEYDNATNANALLVKVKASNRTVEYDYTNLSINSFYQYLTEVTDPEGRKWEYDYDDDSSSVGAYNITKATSPTGLETSYSYQNIQFHEPPFTRPVTVLSTKSLKDNADNNSGTWTYTFTPSTSTTFDITQVVTPTGCEKYEHIGYNNVSSTVGVWSVGSLHQKRTFNHTNCSESSLLQTETYTWTPLKISTQQERQHQGNWQDLGTFMAVQSEAVIKRDGTEYTTTYTDFDDYGSPKTITESGQSNKVSELTYHNDTTNWIVKLPLKETVSESGSAPKVVSVDRTYNTKGQLTEVKNFGVSTKYTYTASGDIDKIKDALDRETNVFSNYFRGIAKTENRPENITLTRTVDYFGNVQSETNGRGHKTDYTYDKLNRLTGITTPRADDDISISWSHNTGPLGPTIPKGTKRTLTRGDFVEEKEFNSANLLVSHSAGGLTNFYESDILGRRTFESNPTFGSSSSTGRSMTYDVLGRLKKLTHADSKKVEYTYKSNNTVDISDELDQVTTYSYRSFGNPDDKNLINISAPEALTTVISRDLFGNLTEVEQNGLKRTYGYNSNYYLTSIDNPETGVTTYGRDLVGNLTSKKIGATGDETTYDYDDLNRLYFITYGSGQAPNELYNYDKNSNILNVTKGSSLWNYSYDENDNLTQEELSFTDTTPNPTYAIQYAYNSRDQLGVITYPSGNSIDYAPNNIGRPTKVGSFITSLSYFPNGHIDSYTASNGHTTSYVQNARLFNTSHTVAKTVGGNLIHRSYDYDDIGNITSITDNLNATNTKTMTYDGINRLKTANGAWGAGTFNYNKSGDITSKQLGSESFTYTYDTTNNQLTGVSGGRTYNFSYDNAGNITSDGEHSYSYQEDGNLVSVDGGEVTYYYDANKRRLLTNRNGQQILSLYSKAGQLMYTKNLSTLDEADHIYLNNQLVVKREYCTADSDYDGISDCTERKWGLNSNYSDDASQDIDGDGITNRQESIVGSNLMVQDIDSDLDGTPDQFDSEPNFNPAILDILRSLKD